MEYKISYTSKGTIKGAIIWNAIAYSVACIIYPGNMYKNGASGEEAMAVLIVMMIIGIPLIIADYILYKKIIANATKNLIILAIIMSILSVLFLVIIPSVVMVIIYLKTLKRDKVE